MPTDPNSPARGGACGELTVRKNWVDALKVPEVPVIVIVAFPTVAELSAVKRSSLVPGVDVGLNEAVTPVGSPEADKFTLPEKPSASVTDTVVVPEAPW